MVCLHQQVLLAPGVLVNVTLGLFTYFPSVEEVEDLSIISEVSLPPSLY